MSCKEYHVTCRFFAPQSSNMFPSTPIYFFSPTSSSGQGTHSTPELISVKSDVTPGHRMLGTCVTIYTALRVLTLG